MQIKILNTENMLKVATMSDAIKACGDAMELYSNGESNIPTRANLAVPEHNGQSLYMYGYAAPAEALGVKVVSVYPNNIEKGLTSVPATMVLVDATTGHVSALMDGTYLTQLRTGAVAGLATDILARKDSKTFALFGTGGQAPAQLEAVLTVREIELVKVFDINLARAQEFATDMQATFGDKFNVKIVAASTSDEAILDADIITAVTTSSKAVFNGRLVKKGAHINGVGSYTPEMAEIDEYIITNADKVYVDTRDGAIKESGDLIQPINKGVYQVESITGEIGEVISGKILGRENNEEITFFESTGSAVLDLVTAQKILEQANKLDIGQNISL